MSNRRRSKCDITNQARSWWRHVGNDLGCLMCRSVPFCDRCGSRTAETVAGLLAHPEGGLEALRQGHLHLCGPCRDHVHRQTGLVRIELSDEDDRRNAR